MEKNSKIFGLILLAVFIWQCSQSKKIDLFLVGDSTIALYDDYDYPLTGWGEKLPLFFKKNVKVHNFGVGGASTKRYRYRMRWAAVLSCIEMGDYVLIQFGHNDEDSSRSSAFTPPHDYYENLKKFVIETREKDGIPILATPIGRRKFDENGKLINTHGKYPDEMRKVAKEMNVPLIDLTKISKPMIEGYGVEGSKKLFRWVESGKYPAYPNGIKDNTHYSEFGATKFAELAAKEIKNLDIELQEYLVIPQQIKN